MESSRFTAGSSREENRAKPCEEEAAAEEEEETDGFEYSMLDEEPRVAKPAAVADVDVDIDVI